MDGLDIVRRRHQEYLESVTSLRWLMDSYIGGLTYRHAEYGVDAYGKAIRNLRRHKREYPDQRISQEPVVNSQINYSRFPDGFSKENTDDDSTVGDYEMRLARTPVPTFVQEAVNDHLGRIYSREISRRGPKELEEWQQNVDGRGRTIDEFMSEEVAPFLMVMGQLDILFYFPVSDPGSLRASIIMPENMVWWKLDPDRLRYEECLVCETFADSNGDPTVGYRHWTKTSAILYDTNGKVLENASNTFGFVPIIRVFDRKMPRHTWIGMSRYECIAEYQREYYNRDSELILADTIQAHPLLQGPEEYITENGGIPIGPGWLLPKKRVSNTGTVQYESFDVLDFPKGASESIRENMIMIRGSVDRAAKLFRPAGEASTKSTVEQSGISKSIDQKPAGDLLTKISRSLRIAEYQIAKMVCAITGSDQEPEIVYPASFDLYTASDVATSIGDLQIILSRSGLLPETEKYLLKRIVRLVLAGLSDSVFSQLDQEIDKFMENGGGIAKQIPDKQTLDPAGNVRNGVSDPTARQQAPGDTPPASQ